MRLHGHLRFLLLAGLFISIPNWNAAAKDFMLVRDSRPEAVIVNNTSSSKVLDQHIQFFNTELKRCTRTELPVVKSAGNERNRIIFKLEKRPLREGDTYTIDFPDARTLRITGTERSIRWAFNHLLEKELGIRWLFSPIKGFYEPEINHYPQLKTVSVKVAKFSDRPQVTVKREIGYRARALTANWNEKLLGDYDHFLSVDVFPFYKYAADNSWPKAILPVINGEKIAMAKPKLPFTRNPWVDGMRYMSGWQPCWSDPETARTAIQNILEILKKNPDKKVIVLDVNDNGGYCECEACLKAVNGKRTMHGLRNYSELYWKWVNAVAKGVTEKYPDMVFKAIAYREVAMPPSFKLHPNVLMSLTLEIASLNDPVCREKNLKRVRDWQEKSSIIGIGDYVHDILQFWFPRIQFTSHSRNLSELVRKYGVLSYSTEGPGATVFHGPQAQLILKVLWNPDLDVEAFLEDWCEHAVGRKAAPYLREYYKLWEDYWKGEDIRKTAWYASVHNIYMQLGECNSHTFALKKGDMKKFRALMEKVVTKAETPEQKKRALVLMQAFEYSELAAAAAFSEIFTPEGQLRSAEDALELVKAIPASLRARDKLAKHPLLQFRAGKSAKGLFDAADASIGRIIPFLKDKRIREQVENLADDSAVPLMLRAQFKIWLGAKAKNLIENGSFEQDKPAMMPLWMPRLNGMRDTRHVSDGRYSFRTGNGYYRIRPKIEPGKTYLLLCDVYIEKGSGEGRFTTKTGPCRGKTPVNWIRVDSVPSGGSWNTFSSVVSSNREGVDNLDIQIYFQKFEQDEPVWIDNIRLYCLDDLVQNSKQPGNPAKKGENDMNLRKNKLATTVLAATASAVILAAGDLPKELEGIPKEEIKEVTQYIYGPKVNDPEASAKGKTVAKVFPANAKKYGGVNMGVYNKKYDEMTKKVIAWSRPKIIDEKYHWYKIRRTSNEAAVPQDTPHNTVIYLEDWKIGARLPNTITGKFDCWVLVKAEGPLYVDGSTKENKVYLSRVLLVPVK